MNFIPFILASGSPRRKQLLNQIGLEFTVIPSDVDEDFTLDLPPEAFTEHWAREKAKSVAKIHPDSLIVGADTIVVLDGNIFGKPKDKKDSFNMLQSLSGKTHEVITGLSFISLEQEVDHTFNEKTFVSFNTLSDRDINSYIDIYNPLDKAASYGIQDWFSVHIHRVEGCYYNVMGLPLSSFYSYFKSVSAFLINHDHHH